jgi:hypothetical protein
MPCGGSKQPGTEGEEVVRYLLAVILLLAIAGSVFAQSDYLNPTYYLSHDGKYLAIEWDNQTAWVFTLSGKMEDLPYQANRYGNKGDSWFFYRQLPIPTSANPMNIKEVLKAMQEEVMPMR